MLLRYPIEQYILYVKENITQYVAIEIYAMIVNMLSKSFFLTLKMFFQGLCRINLLFLKIVICLKLWNKSSIIKNPNEDLA